jgi:rhodanese-related sulfurtransferase
VTFADLATARRSRPVVVLDVRSRRAHDGARLGGVLAIPLLELPRRFGEVPHGEVWVHCADGYRAMVAAALLASLGGRRPIVIDDVFDPRRLAGMRGITVLVGAPPP